jgi:hypothetical protein
VRHVFYVTTTAWRRVQRVDQNCQSHDRY